jgi:hypothetical protein
MGIRFATMENVVRDQRTLTIRTMMEDGFEIKGLNTDGC